MLSTSLIEYILDYLVNVIPALKYVPPWFPGAEWKRTALKWKVEKDTMLDETFNWTKRAVVSKRLGFD